MKNLRLLKTLTFGLVLAAGAACSPDRAPLAPAVDTASVTTAAPDASLLGGDGLLGSDGLLGGTVNSVLSPLSCNTGGYGSATQTIGTDGGTIHIGPHRLVIPRGALDRSVRITATAPKGKSILVEFEPAGLQFRKSASLTLSYRECGILVLNPKVVYVDDRQKLLEILPTIANLLDKSATGRLDHFSGYMLWD